MTRLVAALLLIALGGPPIRGQPVLREDVEVSRVLLDVRVLGRGGTAVLGLGPKDFEVLVDGSRARLESVDWVAGDTPAPWVERSRRPNPGRLLVLFFQRSLVPSRIQGLMQVLPRVEELVEDLGPSDRVAILSFDSHLRLFTDFSGDRERLLDILRHEIVAFREPAPFEAAPYPSLARHLDPMRMKRAATTDRGLRQVAEALEKLPGSKTLVFFCWGLGRMTDAGLLMDRDFEPARQALLRSRTTVFSMDVVQADLHTLQGPLQTLARDTGGFYEKTYVLPIGDMKRLAAATSGHYVLSIENPSSRRGKHRVHVALVGRRGTVLARPSFVD